VPVPAVVTVVAAAAAAGAVVFAITWGKGSDTTNIAGLWVIDLVEGMAHRAGR